MNIIYLQEDLSETQASELMKSSELAVDTELTGIEIHNDNLDIFLQY